jgi:hypothetical protein
MSQESSGRQFLVVEILPEDEYREVWRASNESGLAKIFPIGSAHGREVGKERS